MVWVLIYWEWKLFKFFITTNNDQLALKLGKKINETFHKTEKKVSFSAEPQEVSNIEITFAS